MSNISSWQLLKKHLVSHLSPKWTLQTARKTLQLFWAHNWPHWFLVMQQTLEIPLALAPVTSSLCSLVSFWSPAPSGSSSDWWFGWLRRGWPHRWGRAIQNPIPLSKYYGLGLIVHVGQVQLHPAKRAHSPPHLYTNRGGGGDEMNCPKMERKIHTGAEMLCACVGIFFLFAWVAG